MTSDNEHNTFDVTMIILVGAALVVLAFLYLGGC